MTGPRLAVLALITLAAAGCSKAVDDAKATVANQMRDPSSAQFREVREVRQNDGSLAVCGEVNGKNGFGAYSGFQEFVVHDGRVTLIDPGLTGEADPAAKMLRLTRCVMGGSTLEELKGNKAAMRDAIGRLQAESGH